MIPNIFNSFPFISLKVTCWKPFYKNAGNCTQLFTGVMRLWTSRSILLTLRIANPFQSLCDFSTSHRHQKKSPSYLWYINSCIIFSKLWRSLKETLGGIINQMPCLHNWIQFLIQIYKWQQLCCCCTSLVISPLQMNAPTKPINFR